MWSIILKNLTIKRKANCYDHSDTIIQSNYYKRKEGEYPFDQIYLKGLKVEICFVKLH